MDATSVERFARRVAVACRAAVPAVVALGVVAMLLDPWGFAETEDTGGATPWGGAIAGLAMFLAFTVVPLLLLSAALGSRRRGLLIAAAVAGVVLALQMGLLPLAGALVGGWDGVSPVAVLTAAGAGVLEALAAVAAVQLLRRSAGEPPRPVSPGGGADVRSQRN